MKSTKIVTYTITFFLILTYRWIERKFGAPTLEQIIFHVQYGNEVSRGINPEYIYNFIKNVLLPLAIIVVIIIQLGKFRQRRSQRLVFEDIALGFLPFLALLLTLVVIVYKFKIINYLNYSENDYDFIKEYYVEPNQLKPVKKNDAPKNLIIIYVESLEQSYSNVNFFPSQPMRELDNLAGTSAEYLQVAGLRFTIGSLVATQCGIPLKPIFYSDANLNSGSLRKFLPNSTCLGSILEKNGYNNVFLYGGTANFAGKKTFLESHGYKVFALEHWRKKENISAQDYNQWALNDDQLFEEAKQVLATLSKKKDPFVLSLLTINLHASDGHPMRSCPKTQGNNYEEIVRCTSEHISRFINFAKESGYLKNTVVLVLGDHLAMPIPLDNILEKNNQRTIYQKWIGDIPEFKRDWMTQLDVAPSILDALGFEYGDGRFGLGFSVFREVPELPADWLQLLENNIENRSKFYIDLQLKNP